jgi:hypothetical protein
MAGDGGPLNAERLQNHGNPLRFVRQRIPCSGFGGRIPATEKVGHDYPVSKTQQTRHRQPFGMVCANAVQQ